MNGQERSPYMLQAGDELVEYLLAVRPGKEVHEKVINERKEFCIKYGWETGELYIPQIAVAGFFAKEAMEETVIRWIQNICNLQQGFPVTLNNYGSFPSSGLYLRVQDAGPFRKLGNALKILDGFMASNNCPPLVLIARPHLGFVGELPGRIYEEAIGEYSRKSFYSSFRADKLLLLKKDRYKYQLVNTFTLPSPFTIPE